MATYPIKVPLDSYGGRNSARLGKKARHNLLAEKLERYINDRVGKSEHKIQIFSYRVIATDLDIEAKDVENVLFGVDCGGNGLTVSKRRKE